MIGIDIIKTSRMERLLERFGEKALERFLCETEISLVKNFKTAAGFWAIKEAFSKALGTGIGAECSFHDVRVYKTDKGAPYLCIAKHLVRKYQIVESAISITHDGEYAVAVVHLSVQSATANKVEQF